MFDCHFSLQVSKIGGAKTGFVMIVRKLLCEAASQLRVTAVGSEMDRLFTDFCLLTCTSNMHINIFISTRLETCLRPLRDLYNIGSAGIFGVFDELPA